MSTQVPAKERALNAQRIARIGQEVKAALPAFDAQAFTADVMADLPQLELKARIARTAKGLHDHLPVAGPAALDVLLRSLPPTPEAAGITNDFGLHIYSPHSEYVARYCRTTDLLPHALDALRRFTCYFSAEDAVRYFLNDFPEQTMTAVRSWARDDDYRVRRLASESTRPRLPWSPRINLSPTAAADILTQLYADPSRFVTQSVANHLRDISITDPDFVLTILARWQTHGHVAGKDFTFISREALKNRIKEGWAPAYEFLGYNTGVRVDVGAPRLERTTAHVGESLVFSVEMTSPASAALHVTYVITPVTGGSVHRERVYFLGRMTIHPEKPLSLTKQHPLRPNGTKAVKPGVFELQIQVNGHRSSASKFDVLEPMA